MAEWKERIKDVLVIILGGGRGARLEPLTKLRAKPAVPFAGKYRLIDVPISNALNSGMTKQYVLTQYNSESLHRHIGMTYRFGMFSKGYVHLLAAQQTPMSEGWFQGTADAVRQNLPIIAEHRGDLVLILSGDHMYSMDYREMLRDHVDNGADITVGTLPCSEEEIASFGAVRVNTQGRMIEFREKPQTEDERDGMKVPAEQAVRYGIDERRPYLASMGIYLFSKSALIDLLQGTEVDFGKHIIPAAVESHRVQAHFFTGYWRDIGTIRSFFDAHMDLCGTSPPFSFRDATWPLYTRPRYLGPARFEDSSFVRCLLAEGTTVNGSTISRAVIGVRAQIDRAHVDGALIMGADSYDLPEVPGAPPVGIGEGSEIKDAIIDKNARIGRNVRIVNVNGVDEAEGPGWRIRDGIVVVEKNAIIPDGTVI